VNESLGTWRDILDYVRAVPPIFRQHYWDRPVPREVGDPDPKAICEAVGHALSQWGLADQALADLLVSLTDTRSLENCFVVRRSYYSIQRHRDRTRAIKAAAEAYFPQYRTQKVLGSYASRLFDEAHASHCRSHEAARQFVADTIKAVELATDRYDDIAHGVIWKNVRFYDRDFRSLLMPPEYKTGYRIAGRGDDRDPWGFTQLRYRYTSADIASFAVKFMVLRDRILDCARKVDLATKQFHHYQRSLPPRFMR
jgi:hypothetical protein